MEALRSTPGGEAEHQEMCPAQSMQLTELRRVEVPDDYWAQVIASALADDRLTFDEYRLVEHPYVERLWDRHWELAERLLDDPPTTTSKRRSSTPELSPGE